MIDTHTLTQDNGNCNGMEKRTVVIEKSRLPQELRAYFGWRQNVTMDRLMEQGSYDFDRFIKFLYEKGYGNDATHM